MWYHWSRFLSIWACCPRCVVSKWSGSSPAPLWCGQDSTADLWSSPSKGYYSRGSYMFKRTMDQINMQRPGKLQSLQKSIIVLNLFADSNTISFQYNLNCPLRLFIVWTQRRLIILILHICVLRCWLDFPLAPEGLAVSQQQCNNYVLNCWTSHQWTST